MEAGLLRKQVAGRACSNLRPGVSCIDFMGLCPNRPLQEILSRGIVRSIIDSREDVDGSLVATKLVLSLIAVSCAVSDQIVLTSRGAKHGENLTMPHTIQ